MNEMLRICGALVMVALVFTIALIGMSLVAPSPISSSVPAFIYPLGTKIIVNGEVVGQKIVEDPSFETNFVYTDIVDDTFKFEFYHDATIALSIWIEGDVDYILSTALAEPDAHVTLDVPLVDDRVPKFKLHIGAESEVFEFGTEIIVVQGGECGCDDGSYNYTCGEDVSTSCKMNCNLDISGVDTCFNITANDLTIDCDNYNITNYHITVAGGKGIDLNDVSGTKLYNCGIYNFTLGIIVPGQNNSFENITADYCGTGIIVFGQNNSFENISANYCDDGIDLLTTQNNSFENVNVDYCVTGIFLENATNSSFVNVSAKYCESYGLSITYYSLNNSFTNIDLDTYGFQSLYSDGYSDNSVFVNMNASNSRLGNEVGGDYNEFTNVNANNIGYLGYGLFVWGSNNTFTNFNVSGNAGEAGLYAEGFNNTFADFVITDNTGYGIYTDYGENRFVNIVAEGNDWDWYSEYGSENNTVINITSWQNVISFTSLDVALKGLRSFEAPSAPSGYASVGWINATNNSNTSWLFLNVSYDDDGVDEPSLSMWRYDGSWQNETFYETKGVDDISNIVYANITNFSIFAPLYLSSTCGCNDGSYNYTCGDTIYSSCTMNCNLFSSVGEGNDYGTCFEVGADNIVIDCDGHSITGDNAGYGITLMNRLNVTVTNCSISDFSTGFNVFASDNNTLINSFAHHNNLTGFEVVDSTNILLINDRAEENVNGFVIDPSSFNLISNAIARYNTLGILLSCTPGGFAVDSLQPLLVGPPSYCFGGGPAMTSFNNVTDSLVENNTGVGILINDDNTLVRNTTVRFNGEEGIRVEATLNCLIDNSSIYSNANGIVLSCIPVGGGGFLGALAMPPPNCFVGGGTVSSFNNITNSLVENNTRRGITVNDDNTLVRNNTVRSNGEEGIRIEGTSNCLIDNNSIYDNAKGIWVNYSINNLITNNIIQNNTRDWDDTFHSANNTVINMTSWQNVISFAPLDVGLKGLRSFEAPAAPLGYADVNRWVNATANAAESWLFLNISYDDTGVDEARLSMWRYNGSWQNETFYTEQGIDPANNFVYANVTGFSVFAPLVTPLPTVDDFPYWDNNRTTPASHAGYSPSRRYQFNITWQDDNAVSAVVFENNFNGVANPSPLGNSGNEYFYNYTGLAAGTYYWKSYANDSAGQLSTTPQFVYVVEKIAPTLTLTPTPRWDVYAGMQTTVGCTASTPEVSVSLYQNGMPVINPHTAILNVGSYVYSCNNTGTQNYTSAQRSEVLTVSKLIPTCSLSFNPESGRVYPISVNVSCVCTNPDASATLFRNGADFSAENGRFVELAAGSHYYVCSSTETQNYTSASVVSTYVIKKANPNLSLESLPSWSVSAGSETTVSCSAGTGQVVPDLYRDGTPVNNSDVAVLGAGGHSYSCINRATENYTSELVNLILTVRAVSVGGGGGGGGYKCIPDWMCANWSLCTNGLQNRTCNDLKHCDTPDKPDVQQPCACVRYYECENWGECVNGTQRRECNYTETGINCTAVVVPKTSQVCTVPALPPPEVPAPVVEQPLSVCDVNLILILVSGILAVVYMVVIERCFNIFNYYVGVSSGTLRWKIFVVILGVIVVLTALSAWLLCQMLLTTIAAVAIAAFVVGIVIVKFRRRQEILGYVKPQANRKNALRYKK